MAGKKQRTKSNCFPNLSFAEFRRGVKGADCQLESSLGRRKSVGHRIALQNGYRIVTEWSKRRRRMDTESSLTTSIVQGGWYWVIGKKYGWMRKICCTQDCPTRSAWTLADFLVHNIQQFNMATIKEKTNLNTCTCTQYSHCFNVIFSIALAMLL